MCNVQCALLYRFQCIVCTVHSCRVGSVECAVYSQISEAGAGQRSLAKTCHAKMRTEHCTQYNKVYSVTLFTIHCIVHCKLYRTVKQYRRWADRGSRGTVAEGALYIVASGVL